MPVCARVGRSGLHARRPTRDAGVTKVAEAQTAALGRAGGGSREDLGEVVLTVRQEYAWTEERRWSLAAVNSGGGDACLRC